MIQEYLTGKCCEVELIAVISDEGTGYYKCSKCGNPADIKRVDNHTADRIYAKKTKSK